MMLKDPVISSFQIIVVWLLIVQKWRFWQIYLMKSTKMETDALSSVKWRRWWTFLRISSSGESSPTSEWMVQLNSKTEDLWLKSFKIITMFSFSFFLQELVDLELIWSLLTPSSSMIMIGIQLWTPKQLIEPIELVKRKLSTSTVSWPNLRSKKEFWEELAKKKVFKVQFTVPTSKLIPSALAMSSIWSSMISMIHFKVLVKTGIRSKAL